MASTPGIPWSLTPGTRYSPAGDDGVTEFLGGAVHLACAERPGGAVVAAGFSASGALTRARTRAAAFERLHRLSGRAAERCADGGGRRLFLADFIPRPPRESASCVSGIGLLSRECYHVPVEVVSLGEYDGVEPTMVGVVDCGISEAIADILAHDVVIRWWSDPQLPLLRVSEHLDWLISPAVVSAAFALGVRVSAFVLPCGDFRVALVGVGGEGTTIATAAARSMKGAVREAFLRAIAARAQPWDALSTGDLLRRLAVWHREAGYMARLERLATDADSTTLAVSGIWDDAFSWPDLACRRFGHEPLLVCDDSSGDPVKVVCPGAACYQTAPSALLPCPIP